MSDLVVAGEKLLKLVDDEQHTRQFGTWRGVAITLNVLYSRLPEEISSALQLLIEAIQDAHAEFALALNRDHAGVRQPMCSIGLELHTLLEVDQIKLQLLRRIVH